MGYLIRFLFAEYVWGEITAFEAAQQAAADHVMDEAGDAPTGDEQMVPDS